MFKTIFNFVRGSDTDKLTQLVDDSDLLECLRSVGVEK